MRALPPAPESSGERRSRPPQKPSMVWMRSRCGLSVSAQPRASALARATYHDIEQAFAEMKATGARKSACYEKQAVMMGAEFREIDFDRIRRLVGP